MKKRLSGKCLGLGCLMKYTCKQYLEPRLTKEKPMLSLYTPSNGCVNYVPVPCKGVIKDTQVEIRCGDE